MPTLNWIGKEAVVNHHLTVPFRLLKDVPELSCGDPGSGNLIVEGDNLVALKALLPYYAGQVKCIYIDPPYNTGKEGWSYDDNVNSPLIRKWIGETVGKEGETLDRHDRWLCMMYPRLSILKEFLHEDGVIFISIDDNEVAALRYLMDEIFGKPCFVSQIAWQKIYTRKNSAQQFSEMHDHLLVYALKGKNWIPNLLDRSSKQDDAYTNLDSDERGPWKATPIHARNRYDDGKYPIISPTGETIKPPTGTYWRFSKESFERLRRENRIWWGEQGTNVPAQKSFLSEVKSGVVATTWWPHTEAGHNGEAKTELRELLGELPDELLTPKPKRLIQQIISLATSPDSIVMDSFAGSGTTGHAVLASNKADGGNRKFLLVEQGENTAKSVTANRVRRVIEGYSFTGTKKETILSHRLSWSLFKNDAKRDQIMREIENLSSKSCSDFDKIGIECKGDYLKAVGERRIESKVEGLGGGFRYCQLGDPLFDESGEIRKSVTFAELARHVWFTETGEPLPKDRVKRTPLLGDYKGTGIFLLYNGIIEDKSPGGGNVLTRAILADLPPYDGQRVIYCAGCRIGAERLRKEKIVIRQTPYEIKVS